MDLTGLPLSPGLVRMGICLFSGLPLAALFNLVPPSNPAARHLFSVVTTATLAAALFGLSGMLHMLVPALATYALVRAAGRHAWTPVAVFVGTLAHLSVVQATAQLWHHDDPTYIDMSAPMMMLTIKLSSFAWSVYDGTKPDKDLHEDMRPFAIREMPDLLEFAGFVFFFASVWAGPAFDYQYYYEFTRSQGPYRAVPSRTAAALRVFGLGAFFLTVFLVLDPNWNARNCDNHRFLKEYSFPHRVMLIYVAGFLARIKLAAAWKITESAAIITGIGYTGTDPKTGKPVFDRFENVNIREVELGQNVKAIADAWNKKTSAWLKRAVYLRVAAVAPNTVATGLTTLTSALWHGFYPGYYLAFLSLTFVVFAARSLRRTFHPLFVTVGSPFVPYKPVYDVVGHLVTLWVLNYLFMPFHVRWIDVSVRIWASLYFYGHVVVGITIVVLNVLGGGAAVRRWFAKIVPQSKDGGGKPRAKRGDGGIESDAGVAGDAKKRE
nr:lysophospholipid acyltransferase [Polyrhizophydium stewartii]